MIKTYKSKNNVIDVSTSYPYVPTNANSAKGLDSNLALAVKILKQNKIPYWLCHGTLLGIVRDKQLIEWKNDVDIAIWDKVVSKKKLIELMTSNNFKLLTNTFFVGDNILYFYRSGGRLVDIHFYEIKYVKVTNKNMAVVNSGYVPKNIYLKFINAMSMSRGYNGKFKYLIRMFCIFEPFFKFIKLKLIKNNLFYNSVSACEPLELLKEFKEIDFFGIKITIPYKSEELVKYMYGEGWKTPDKNYFYLPGQGLGDDHKNRPPTLIEPLNIS